MTPDRQPRPLRVDRVEWVPSSPDEIEVRLYGAWGGSSVPPEVSLVVGDDVFAPLPDPPPPGPAPAWSAAYRVPIEARAPIEEGNAAIAGPDFALPLPEGRPGALDGPSGTVVDPEVLAERRARRAEESAERGAVSAEQTVETLRAQLGHLEARAARVGAERDALAGRVADAEQRLRLAERRELEERQRRAALEEEAASARGGAEAEVADLRARLSAAGEDAGAESEELRTRLVAAEEAAEALERELSEVQARVDAATQAVEVERAARAEAEAAATRAESEADALRAESRALRAEVDALRAELDGVRAEAESSRARAAVAEDLRARIAELERRLVAQPQPRTAENESLRARVAELDRQLAAEREAREAAEERLAAAPAEERAPGEPSDRERALVAQVAALEGELARRAKVQQRVQEAIALVRDELGQVRQQVDQAESERAAESASVEELRRELANLAERARVLEAALQERGVELEAARSELARARTETAAAHAEADRRRQDAEGAERGAAEARRLARELAERLASEEAARAAAEQRLAQVAESAPGDPSAPATGDAALDTLITGLRAQVAAAREQLARWGVPEDAPSEQAAPPAAGSGEQPEPPAAEPAEPPRAERGASASDFPALDEPLPPKEPGARGAPPPVGATPPPAAAASPPAGTAPPAAGAVPPAAGAVPPPAGAAPPTPPATEDETRRRLQAIAAELRAAVPAESAQGGQDVIGDLQRAAERLRAAAEQELERLEQPSAPAEAPPRPAAPAAPVAEPLGPRPVYGVPESAWLRSGLERLAQREPDTAARLFAALLPAQALAADDVTYEVTAPPGATLRVTIAGGVARVEPRDAPAPRGEIDLALAGTLDVLAPLAAGGAGRRLKGADARGSRRRLRRLLKARRRPLTLHDLTLAGAAVHPGLLLAALAAAVEPAWTHGHRFAVAYEVAGDGTFSVVVADGRPLRVLEGARAGDGIDAPPLAATVTVGARAFMPLLAGLAPPAGERAAVLGDRRAADTLHAWFDAARGVGAR